MELRISLSSPGWSIIPSRPPLAAAFALMLVFTLSGRPLRAHETAEAHAHTGGSHAATGMTQKPAMPVDSGPQDETFTGDVYTLGRCAGCPTDLSVIARPTHWVLQGRDLQFCCPHCKKHFESDSKEALGKVDADIIKQQKPFYPLTTCLVSKDPLDSKGEAVDFVYMNSLVRVCSKECRAEFDKGPQTFMKQLHAAVVERQKSSYPLTTCVVSGEILATAESPVEYVAGNRLVRLCRAECEKTFEQNPAKHLAKIDAATKEKAGETPAGSAVTTTPAAPLDHKDEKTHEARPSHH